jgi:membrane protease YdiL (CAAX protease family)
MLVGLTLGIASESTAGAAWRLPPRVEALLFQLLNGAILIGLVVVIMRTGGSNVLAKLGLVRCAILPLLGVSFATGLLALAASIGARHRVLFQNRIAASLVGTKGEVSGYYIALLLLAPVWEEPVLRGFLYTRFREHYQLVTSVLIIATAGLLQHPTAWSGWLPFMAIGLLQVVLCVSREITGNLWPCIVGHCCYNLILVLLS